MCDIHVICVGASHLEWQVMSTVVTDGPLCQLTGGSLLILAKAVLLSVYSDGIVGSWY